MTQIPAIPKTIHTSGVKAPEALSKDPNPALTQEAPPPEDAQVAQITFNMPVQMLQAFQSVVAETEYLQGQENFAILQAIDLWIQSTLQYKDGNQMAFLLKNGNTTHMRLNPNATEEEFHQEVADFHEARKKTIEAAMLLEKQKK